jgi:plasmid stability protein
MPIFTISELDSELAQRLRERATRHGHSIEDEAVAILRDALKAERKPKPNLAESVRARFGPIGGVELPESVRKPMPDPVDMGR